MDYGLTSHTIVKRFLERAFHTFITPTLDDFGKHTVWASQSDVLKNIPRLFEAPADIVSLKAEFDLLKRGLDERYRKIKLTHPTRFAIEDIASFFIYSLVRAIRPGAILETGVANGHSTYYILNALAKNNSGMLHSVDVSEDAGILLEEDEKGRWDFSVLPTFSTRRKDFRTLLERIGTLDVFFHDSNHFYYWQNFEYNSVLSNISHGGYVLSDDADSSYAFLDFSKEQGLKPTFITDYRKVFGFVRL